MTIIGLAYAGFKALDNLFLRNLRVSSVDHLSDAALKDIGLYREGGQIFALDPERFAIREEKIASKDESSESSVIMIPHYLNESGG